jgi:hypothetical protein
MRKLNLTFVFFLICTIGLFAQAKQDFTIVNKTGVIINELHVTPHDSDEWGEDILGRDVLDIDQECDIEFHPKEDACLWDLRIADDEGNAIEWENLDLCKAVKITLHYKDGKAWADIEE